MQPVILFISKYKVIVLSFHLSLFSFVYYLRVYLSFVFIFVLIASVT